MNRKPLMILVIGIVLISSNAFAQISTMPINESDLNKGRIIIPIEEGKLTISIRHPKIVFNAATIKPILINKTPSIVLNETPLVIINKTEIPVPIEIKPAKAEHILINETPLIVTNVTNPALQLEIQIVPKVFHKVTIVRNITDNSLRIESNNITAKTIETLKFNDSKLYIKTPAIEKIVNVMPDRASQRILQIEPQAIKDMELKILEEKPVYIVKGVKPVKIFGLFNAEMKIESKIDADTGEIKQIKKPWWRIFARKTEFEKTEQPKNEAIISKEEITLEEEDPALTEARKYMVDAHLKGRDIVDDRVLEVMGRMPRHKFVREEDRDVAYADHPLPIAEGQTISQPYVVALMTQALKLNGSERVLEIGTGSGYQAAVLAELVDEVYTIEIRGKLASSAAERLSMLGYSNVYVRQGDGYFGWEEHAPFDAIMITAAVNHIPLPLIEQLKDGGRLILPLGSTVYFQTLTMVEKRGGELTAEHITSVRFVPMIGEAERRS